MKKSTLGRKNATQALRNAQGGGVIDVGNVCSK